VRALHDAVIRSSNAPTFPNVHRSER
jgi:hypothetical protein